MTVQILAVHPGSVTEQDKTILRDNGVVVVETENLANVRLMQAEVAAINANGILWAALEAIYRGSSYVTQEQLSKNLAKVIKKPEGA